MPANRAALGVLSGVGLVVANMIGVGVLTTAGYMAYDLSPGRILVAWLVGGLVAMAGARAYGALAELIPRSGGEYRYLSEVVHPFAGYLAGWTSLLVGFSAPVAAAAYAAGPFAATLWPGIREETVGIGLIVFVTVFHASNLKLSKGLQDLLVAAKIVLLVGFVVAGVALGSKAWPTWQPANTHAGFPVEPFMVSLVFIAYSYSGWNAAVYAAEEFREPARDVPRAMVLGAGLVAIAYVLVNWVFVANLSAVDLTGWTQGDTRRITLGHVILVRLVGEKGAMVMSVFVLLALFSSISAMMLVGPRVYAAMARDRFLPKVLEAREGRPPAASVALQGAIAIALLLLHRFDTLLRNVGAILTLTAAITVSSLFVLRIRLRGHARPSALPLACAAIYVVASGWMLAFALRDRSTLRWIGVVVGATIVAYGLTRWASARRRV
jgi:basic amino acid/polyamine antiporter, APA family